MPRKKKREQDGSQAADWLDALWKMAQRVIDAPEEDIFENQDGNIIVKQRGIDAARKLGTIAQAAKAAYSMLDREQLDKEHLELKAMVIEIMSARTHGTRLSGGIGVLEEAPSPAKQIR